MFMDRVSQLQDRVHGQPSSLRMALSPGVLAALERVHFALRKAYGVVRPCHGSSSLLQVLAEKLAADGLLVTLRSGLGVGIDSPDYLATLRHSFLICQEGSSGLCVIVDPSFREQFKVAGMPHNSAYSTAVANVPECFVGTIGTVNALVCLLTGTLLQESAALGIELPPWRSKQALLSKWLPRRFADSVFAPPSSVPLHPALRSSVHGAAGSTTLSTSPTSIQSWPSLAHTHSEFSSSNGSSAACGSATTACSREERCPARALSKPHTVITGFAAPAAAAAAHAHAAAATSQAGKCGAAAPRAPCPGRSALTAQLASAADMSRAVQADAESHWQRCLQSLRCCTSTQEATATSQPQAGAAAYPTSSTVMEAATPTASDLLRGGSLQGRVPGSSLHVDMLHSLVVSPVHRRASGGPASLKRGASCSLKLTTATLKMLPRVYTVKLATAGGC